MRISRARTHLVCLAASLAVIAAGGVVAGCNGNNGPKVAHVGAKSMPDGQEWTGVYFSPQFGELHLVEKDGHAYGRWKAKDESKWGKMSGTVDGAVFHFSWDEYLSGFSFGTAGHQHGKGYFVFGIDGDGNPTIKGEYGNDEDEVGAPWNAVKEKNKVPHPDTIGGQGGPDDTFKDHDKPEEKSDDKKGE
jgi:hypothetical protein